MTNETIAFKLASPSHIPDPDRFETEPDARAQHIEEMVGIKPDPRHFIPEEETADLIRGTQIGNTKDAENLLATRLKWMYKKFATIEAVRDRPDLELRDVMQLGCVATLTVAHQVRFEKPMPVNIQLYQATVREMAHMMMTYNLIPWVNLNTNEVSYRGFRGDSRITALIDPERLVDPVLAVGDDVLDGLVEDQRHLIPDSNENQIINQAPSVHDLCLKVLSGIPRSLRIIIEHYGLDGRDPRTLDAIGLELGMTKERVRQLESVAFRRIIRSGVLQGLDSHDLFGEDFTNYGLPALAGSR